MIGQKANLEIIKKWRLKRSTPRFILITGQGERLSLALSISMSLNANHVIVGKSIDEVRQVIQSSYKVTDTTVYIFEYGDTMSNAANNAILKITEEPPNNAYFVILAESNGNILETIKSRATPLIMVRYKQEELSELTSNELLLKYCSTPEQIREYNYREKDFEKLVNTCKDFINNIGKMSGVEVLRIAEKVKLKDDQDGYDPILFIEICQREVLYSEEIKMLEINNLMNFSYWCNLFKLELQKTGIKKDSTFDRWLLATKGALE